MSYDIYLEVDLGGLVMCGSCGGDGVPYGWKGKPDPPACECGGAGRVRGRVGVDSLPHWNFTSNVAPMWRKAMPDTDGLAGMDEMLAKDALPVLRAGIERMEADPDTYRELNPANGWGDFDSQLERLRVLQRAFEAAPEATVVVSR